MPPLTLTGLDGTNPLGFLAALGALLGSSRERAVSLRWELQGTWLPVLDGCFADLDALVEELDRDRLECRSDPALALTYGGKRDLKPKPKEFRRYLESLVGEATAKDRRSVDWAAAFATDVAVDNNGNTKPTALHFTAGQQQFLQMVGDLAGTVTAADLREALEGPWTYSRPLPVMGWDSTSTRDYALRASDPSLDKKLGVPGADWLAVRGLAMLPVAPRGTRVLTTCCSGGWKDGQFTWPLWTVPLSATVSRTLLGQEVGSMTPAERRARGIGIVLSSGIRRSDQGGYGSFEPATVC